jgi:hypothetical protein
MNTVAKSKFVQNSKKKYFSNDEYHTVDEFLLQLTFPSKPAFSSILHQFGPTTKFSLFEIGKHIGQNFIDDGTVSYFDAISELKYHFSRNAFHLNEDFLENFEINNLLAAVEVNFNSKYSPYLILGIVSGLADYFNYNLEVLSFSEKQSITVQRIT